MWALLHCWCNYVCVVCVHVCMRASGHLLGCMCFVLNLAMYVLKRVLIIYKQVDVRRVECGGLQIGIECKKKSGLMVALMEAMESFGLLFTNVNVSCQDDNITIDALSTKVIIFFRNFLMFCCWNLSVALSLKKACKNYKHLSILYCVIKLITWGPSDWLRTN